MISHHGQTTLIIISGHFFHFSFSPPLHSGSCALLTCDSFLDVCMLRCVNITAFSHFSPFWSRISIYFFLRNMIEVECHFPLFFPTIFIRFSTSITITLIHVQTHTCVSRHHFESKFFWSFTLEVVTKVCNNILANVCVGVCFFISSSHCLRLPFEIVHIQMAYVLLLMRKDQWIAMPFN